MSERYVTSIEKAAIMHEFHQWLKDNDTHLRSYTPDEIARLAIACGFPLYAICPNVIEKVIHIGRLTKFWESPLADKWLNLVEYETGFDTNELR